ncbi:MAG TPA: helix-turn-helix domain-containing protein [Tepidiformaceae bacterium]
MGVGVGHYLDHVPEEMIAHARQLRTPIFEAPLSVPFRRVVQYVYDALGSSDLHHLRRALAVQSRLVDLVCRECSALDLITSLSEMLSIPVALFDHRGTVVALGDQSARAKRVAACLREAYQNVDGSVGPLGFIEVDEARFYYRQVTIYGVVERVLAALLPKASAPGVVELALEFAGKLVGIDLLRRREQLLSHRRRRDLLLDDFLEGRMSSAETADRMGEEGLDLSQPWRLVMCEAQGQAVAKGANLALNRETVAFRTKLLDTADELLDECGLALLSRLRGNALDIIVNGDYGDEESTRKLLTALHSRLETAVAMPVAIGCSTASSGSESATRQDHQAAEALQHARDGSGSQIVLYEELARRFHLLEDQSSEMLEALYERLIAPLVRNDERHRTSLELTLRVWLDQCLSTHRASEALFVHRNTLGKRLRRIEEIVDVHLDRVDDVVDLNLALRAGDLLLKSPVSGESGRASLS